MSILISGNKFPRAHSRTSLPFYREPQALTIVAEGVDGVFAGGLGGGVDAEDEADSDGGGESDH